MGVRSIWTLTVSRIKGLEGSETLPVELLRTGSNERQESAGESTSKELFARDGRDADGASVIAVSKKLIALENPAYKLVLTHVYVTDGRARGGRTRTAFFPHREDPRQNQQAATNSTTRSRVFPPG